MGKPHTRKNYNSPSLFQDRELFTRKFYDILLNYHATLEKKYDADLSRRIDLIKPEDITEVLYLYGVGGIGKSSFLKERIGKQEEFWKCVNQIITQPDPSLSVQKLDYACIYYDFSSSDGGINSRSSITQTLVRGLTQLPFDYEMIRTNLCLLKLALLQNTSNYHLEINNEFQETMDNLCHEKSQLLKETALKIVSEASGKVDKIRQVFHETKNLIDKVEDVRFIAYCKNNSTLNDAIEEIDSIDSIEKLYDVLPYYFAEDLQDNKKYKKDSPTVVFMMDTLEQYQSKIHDGSTDSFFLKLIWNSNTAIWVIAGRNIISSDNQYWNKILLDRQYQLRDLEIQYVFKYLKDAGICLGDGSEKDINILNSLYSLTGGMPLYLYLCKQISEKATDDNERRDPSFYSTETTIEGSPHEVLVKRYIDAEFKTLGYIAYFYVLCCLHSWDHSVLEELSLPRSNNQQETVFNSIDDFHKLKQIENLSIIEKLDDDYFRVHPIIAKATRDFLKRNPNETNIQPDEIRKSEIEYHKIKNKIELNKHSLKTLIEILPNKELIQYINLDVENKLQQLLDSGYYSTFEEYYDILPEEWKNKEGLYFQGAYLDYLQDYQSACLFLSKYLYGNGHMKYDKEKVKTSERYRNAAFLLFLSQIKSLDYEQAVKNNPLHLLEILHDRTDNCDALLICNGLIMSIMLGEIPINEKTIIEKTMEGLITAYQSMLDEERVFCLCANIFLGKEYVASRPLLVCCSLAKATLYNELRYNEKAKSLLDEIFIDYFISLKDANYESIKTSFGIDNIKTLLNLIYTMNGLDAESRIKKEEFCIEVIDQLPYNEETDYLHKIVEIKRITTDFYKQAEKIQEYLYFKSQGCNSVSYPILEINNISNNLDKLVNSYKETKKQKGIRHWFVEELLNAMLELIEQSTRAVSINNVDKYIHFLFNEYRELIESIQKNSNSNSDNYRLLSLKHRYASFLFTLGNSEHIYNDIISIYKSINLDNVPSSCNTFKKKILYNYGNFMYSKWYSDFDKFENFNVDEIIEIYSSYLEMPFFYPSEKTIRVVSRLFYLYCLKHDFYPSLQCLKKALKTLHLYFDLWKKYSKQTGIKSFSEECSYIHEIGVNILSSGLKMRLINLDSYFFYHNFIMTHYYDYEDNVES